ncbi:ZIP family metal transporter [Nocardioides sp. Iso805N]|uniref:ZIP family metal transporter n=1 Tax=Nocardioides sp. Iso805N TaxID=1283287 RepID=UPI000365767F|nr:hypothetical protein [Nocardioides sp. Iso805N]
MSTAWAALGWGALSSASLFIGQWLAGPLGRSPRRVGLMMGFGAGTMLSAVAYELIPESNLKHGLSVGVSCLIGALAYYVGDRLVDQGGGADRQAIDGAPPSGSGAAMFIGALLDGVPEALILGITLAAGGTINLAFLAAIFVSNVPQGLAGTTSLREAGYTNGRITVMWGALTVACAIVSLAGYLLSDQLPTPGLDAEAFAGGAVLVMLSDSMMPEAFEHGGRSVGLLTVFGFLVAGVLTVVQ